MASSFQTLPKIKRPFAENGDRRELLENNDASSNRASMQAGWNSVTSTPIDQNGVPANRLDFNQLGYLATVGLLFLEQGGFITYDATTSTNIGGYPKGAILWVLDSNNVPAYAVRCTQNNNTNNPATNMTGWQRLTLNPNGDYMAGTLLDINAAQIRNIQLVTQEPATGTDGVIYAIIQQA